MGMVEFERCDECGFDGSDWTDESAVNAIDSLAERWAAAVGGISTGVAAQRPIDQMWSIGEYVDHVREVLFGMRFVLDVAVANPGTDLGASPPSEFSAEAKPVDLKVALESLTSEADLAHNRLTRTAEGVLVGNRSVRRRRPRRSLDCPPCCA